MLAPLAVVAGPVEAGIDQRVGDHIGHVVFADEVRLKSHKPAVLAGNIKDRARRTRCTSISVAL